MSASIKMIVLEKIQKRLNEYWIHDLYTYVHTFNSGSLRDA